MLNLDKIDPTKVPLPNGTEVGTRLDLPIENSDKFIPQGSVGRVKETREDGKIRIAIPGRGEFIYDREDLHPRKDGQVKFAVNREESFERYKSYVFYEALVGSHAWGLSDENSDRDIRGVYVWPFWDTIGLTPSVDNIQSLDNSGCYWEIQKTIQQLLRADPNSLEMLYVPTFSYGADRDPLDYVGKWLREGRSHFASQLIYGSFGRYALSQSTKMRQSLRLADHRTILLDDLRKNPDQNLDQLAEKLRDQTMVETDKKSFQRAKDYIKQLYISLFDQGLLQARSFDALKEFAQSRPDDLELPRDLRPKNAYNLLRIVSSAVHWLETGDPIIETTGELNEKLWKIKRGEVDLETALGWTELAAEGLEVAHAKSVLPELPDYEFADKLLRRYRKHMAMHHCITNISSEMLTVK